MSSYNSFSIGLSFLFLSLASMAYANDLKGSFLGGLGDKFFQLFTSEAEQNREERKLVIESFAGSDGSLNADEAEALRVYDAEATKSELEALISFQDAQFRHLFKMGQNVSSLREKRISKQVNNLETLIIKIRQAILDNDLVGARMSLTNIKWLNVGDQSTDDYYAEIYEGKRRILEGEVSN